MWVLVATWFRVQFGGYKQEWIFSKTAKLLRPVVFEKLTPNCSRNHAVTCQWITWKTHPIKSRRALFEICTRVTTLQSCYIKNALVFSQSDGRHFFLILLKSKATACLWKKCNQQKQVLKRKKKLFTPILSDEKVDTADHERVQHQTFCVLHTRKV